MFCETSTVSQLKIMFILEKCHRDIIKCSLNIIFIFIHICFVSHSYS